jgi:hypothetical protein
MIFFVGLFCIVMRLSAADVSPLPAEHALKVSSQLVEQAGKLEKLPFRIDADPQKGNGFHIPDKFGALVVPVKGLAESEELAAKFKTDPGAPLAYLFLYRLAPRVDGKRAEANRVYQVKIEDGQGVARDVNAVLLAVRQPAADDYRLHVYGTGPKPLIDARFAAGQSTGPTPVSIELKDINEAAREGTIVVTVFGQFQASFPVAYTGE